MKNFILGLSASMLLTLTNLQADEAAAPKAEGSFLGSPLVGILLMFAVFFFLIILPQSRRAKKQTEFLSSLQKGEPVVTTTGLYGKIASVSDRVITLEIAPNVRIRVDRQAIAARETTPPAEKLTAQGTA